MRKINKIYHSVYEWGIKKIVYLNVNWYMSLYVKSLKKKGVNINGKPKFIAKDVYFDGSDYSKIKLGDVVVISRGVTFLTHDYSITTGLIALGEELFTRGEEKYFSKHINIGDNCFIGANSIILPGTTIGDNCIIGAGSVVRGEVPNNSIVLGNPAKIISKTTDWAEKKKYSKNIKIG